MVISAFNEMSNAYFSRIIKLFSRDPFFECIVIDGGSTDGTLEYLMHEAVQFTVLINSTRAARINAGIHRASSSHVLLQHPRSLISNEGITFLKQQASYADWAAFTHQFDHAHIFLKFISWYSNYVRLQKKKIVYLDHCMLIRKDIIPSQIPDIAIFEDTALSNMLREAGHEPVLLPYYAQTSAIRFLARGVYKQFILNQYLKWLYHKGYNDKKMNQLYERHLNLNQRNDMTME